VGACGAHWTRCVCGGCDREAGRFAQGGTYERNTSDDWTTVFDADAGEAEGVLNTQREACGIWVFRPLCASASVYFALCNVVCGCVWCCADFGFSKTGMNLETGSELVMLTKINA
jgi:hypothetical protein